MCLIIVKPRGLTPPPQETIEQAHDHNPDGFGLAWWKSKDTAVHIVKGAMTLPDINTMLNAVPDIEQTLMVLHFRMATTGYICPENCHPLPVSRRKADLTALSIDTPFAIAHNGVVNFDDIDGAVYYINGKYEARGSLSDTQQFVQKYVAPMGRAALNPKVQKIIAEATNSKFAFFTPGKVRLGGRFIKDIDGLFYSNTFYKPAATYPAHTSIGKPDLPCEVCSNLVWVRFWMDDVKTCNKCFDIFATEEEKKVKYTEYLVKYSEDHPDPYYEE